MTKRLSSFRNLYIPLIVICLLLIPFAMYEIYYVEGREAYLRDRSFRILAAAGDQLNGLVNIEADKLRAAGGRFNFSDKEDRALRSAWAIDTFRESSFGPPWNPLKSALPHAYGHGGFVSSRDGFVSLEVLPLPSSLSVSMSYTESGKTILNETRSLDAPLRRRIEQLSPDFFDDVLVADTTGAVLFEAKNLGPHIYRIDQLNVKTDSKNGNSASQQSSAGPSSATQWFTAASQASAVRDVMLAGTDYKLFLQPARVSVKYKQTERPGDGSLKLIVCGLWRGDRWQAESFALPYPIVIWVVLTLLTVFCFAWPFVKVTYMNAKERFRPRDGWYMMLSTVFATVLLTLILSNAYYESFKQWTTRHELQALATNIKSSYQNELQLYLSEFNDLLRHREFVSRVQAASHWDPTHLDIKCDLPEGKFHEFDQAFYATSDGQQLIKLLVKGAVTPQTNVGRFAFFQRLNNGVWVPPPVDSNWPDKYEIQMLRSPNTGEFQVLIGKRYPFGHSSNENPNVLKGLSPGSTLVVVTRPVTLVNPILPPGYGFAVVNQHGLVQLHSDSIRDLQEDFFEECHRDPYLLASLLAGKDEMQEIDYEGETKAAYVTPLTGLSTEPLMLVVFRSAAIDQVAHVGVILFCALLLGVPALVLILISAIDLMRGRRRPPTFLWPKPEYTSGYVYVFLTNCMCTGIFIECCVAMPDKGPGALIVEAVIVVAVTIAFSIQAFKGTVIDIPVPERVKSLLKIKTLDSRAVLVGSAGILLLITYKIMYQTAATTLASSGHTGPHWPLALPAIFAAGSLVGVLYVPWIPKRFFHGAYTAAAVSVLVAVVVVPTIALFRASWETVNELELRHSELAVHKAYIERKQELEEEYRASKAPAEFISDRLQRGWYRDPFFDWKQVSGQPTSKTAGARHAGSPKSNLSALLEDILVHSAWLCVPGSRLGAEVMEADIGRMTRTADWVEVDGQPRMVLDNRALIAREPFSWPAPWWLPLLHLAVLSALSSWIYLLLKRLFLTDSHPAPPLPNANWKTVEDIASPHIVIGHSRSRKSTKLRCIANLPTLDLRIGLKEGTKFQPWPASTKVVALDHFEFNMDDPDYNKRRLELLEELLYVHRYVVVIISTLDPLYYLQEGGTAILTTNTDPASAAAEATKLLDRWSRALSKFKKVELFDHSGMDFDRVVRIAAGGDPVLNNFAGKQPGELQAYLSSLGKVMVIARTKCAQHSLGRLAALLPGPPLNITDEIERRRQGQGTDFRAAAQIALDGFENNPEDPATNAGKLQILEELAANPNGDCVVLSFIDPWGYFNDEEHLTSLSTDVAVARHSREQWDAVLSKFKMLDVTNDGETKLAQMIQRECNATAYLRRVGASLFDELTEACDSTEFPDREHLVQRLLDRVDSYYRVLWSSFTENERLVLYQLSRDGWANPLNRAAIQQLQRKEFVSKTVPYQIMNESFRRFVLSVADDVELQMWQKQEDESSWHSVKLGLITMFVVLGAWLLYAQKDLFQLSIGYMVTLGGAVTAVLNFLGSFKGRAADMKK